MRPSIGGTSWSFAADHGVAVRGVSAYPAAVTPMMVANFVAGGAAINVLARQVGARISVVDVGVAADLPATGRGRGGGRLVRARVANGTADLSVGPAMTDRQTRRAIEVGLRTVERLGRRGVDVIGIGEMGIGNTTAAAALVAALTGVPAEHTTGRGTGLDDDAWRHKVAVVAAAVERHRRTSDTGALATLADLGGLEIAGLVGVIVGGAAARIPIVLDGYITGAAALVAEQLAPGLAERLLAGHRSVEPGHRIVLESTGTGAHPRPRPAPRRGHGCRPRDAGPRVGGRDPRRDGDLRVGGRPGSRVTDAILVRHGATRWTGLRYCGRSDPG